MKTKATAAAAAKLLQSCPTLCDPIDGSPPGSFVHGILQARILEWLAISSPGDLPDPGIKPEFPELAGRFFITEPPGKHTTPNATMSDPRTLPFLFVLL